MIGVVFDPGALTPYVRPSAIELADRSVELAEVWTLGSLLDELAGTDAASAQQRIEQELAARRSPNDAHCAGALEAARAICRGAESTGVANAIGIDRRELVPIFRCAVGVGIKHFANLQRFRRSMLAMRSASPPALAAIAADQGYSDQAHLTREIQTFAGVAPTVLLGEVTSIPNHLPADKMFKTPQHGRSRMGT